jgi:SpoVK/Ycf46/Vps4 family AAA+-type ATPase
MEGQTDDPAGLLNELDVMAVSTVMIARNYHWNIKDGQSTNYELVQKFLNRTETYSSAKTRKAFIIVGSELFDKAIPELLQKDFLEIAMELPKAEEIEGILDSIVKAASASDKFKPPSKDERSLIIQNSKGMTSREITNAYSYSIIKDEGKLVPMTVADIQAKEIANTKGCSIGKYDNVPEPIGMEQLKLFYNKTLRSKRGTELAKGVIFVGPAGAGKTMFVQWASAQSKLKIIFVEPAELFGGIVGTTENNVIKLIEIIVANAPCIVFIDEMEKGFAGMGKQNNGGGGSDGGLTEKAFAPLLKFLSDGRPEGVYFFATCNEIEKMPAAWVRAERWDAIFYIGLPKPRTQEVILEFYKKQFGVKGRPSNMDGWSGAEIKTCCRLAAMMETTCNEAERFVIPISKTMKKEIDYLNKWAKDRCISADMPVTGKITKEDRALQI